MNFLILFPFIQNNTPISRFWWSLVDSLEENPNFVWTQIKNKQFLEHLSNLRSSEISLSQTQDSPSSSLNKQAIQHLIYEYSKQNTLVSSSEYSSFLSILKKTAQTKSLSLIKEESSHLVIENSLESSIHNHFEGNFNLGNKKALYHNLRNLFDSLKKSIFDIIPMTFHLRKGLEDSEYQGFLDYFKENKGLWIIKPGENSNRGKGIEITDDISVINRIITSKETHKNGKRKTFILQSYIEKPLLYNKRKFDIRCYMLVTEGNKNMKAFWYKEGYIRTSSKDFSLKNLGNRLVHLTNDAVQKKADDYGKFEPSNKVISLYI